MREDCSFDPRAVLDSMNDGVYVTDTTRQILYWGAGAERITGWRADEILGKCCYDDVLCHVDKDGHRLCGQEYCPLHRSIVTGQSSTLPIIVFARHRAGGRVPLKVSVAPVRNGSGKVVGGVETFRDLSADFADLERVRKIQSLTMRTELPEDDRIRFSTHYIPHDVIGGDYYAIEKLDADRYGFLLSDVTGHGVAAALYTMYLNSLWRSHQDLVVRPSEFARIVGADLYELMNEDAPFAASVCGVFDLDRGELRTAGAGNPPGFLIRADGAWQQLQASGLPLGCIEGATYDETAVGIRPGDCILFFTDGATEVTGTSNGLLNVGGLETLLKGLGYPGPDVGLKTIEERMLALSDRIRFDDDLTFLEVRIGGASSYKGGQERPADI
jgi:phosphoserine phosphatase RsbU/P